MRLKLPLHIKNQQIAKSNMLQFYLAPKIAKLKTRKKKAHDFCMKFITHKIKWEQGTNIFYCFASLWHFIKGSFNQVNKLWYVKHITVKKKIRRVVYLVLRAAFSCWSCFLIVLHCPDGCHAISLHQDSKICDAMQSIT